MYPEATEVDGILMMRIDAPLFFANVESVKLAIRKFETAYEARGRRFEFVVLDLSPCVSMDASAIHWLTVRRFRPGFGARWTRLLHLQAELPRAPTYLPKDAPSCISYPNVIPVLHGTSAG